jgi:hypothetical protein
MMTTYIQIDDKKVEAKGEVLNALLQFQDEIANKNATFEAEVETKAVAKAALLERLGISAEEAALLLG